MSEEKLMTDPIHKDQNIIHKYLDLKPITEEHGGLILNNIYKNMQMQKSEEEVLLNRIARTSEFKIKKTE